MKQLMLVVVIVMVAGMLASCVPVEPRDMLPYCKGQYEILLAEHPDYPHAFIGACVSYLQTGKPTAYVSLCGYEPFREGIEEHEGIEINTKKECMDFIRNYELEP